MLFECVVDIHDSVELRGKRQKRQPATIFFKSLYSSIVNDTSTSIVRYDVYICYIQYANAACYFVSLFLSQLLVNTRFFILVFGVNSFNLKILYARMAKSTPKQLPVVLPTRAS
jgi:Flp pilus assembly protein TadB